MTEIAQPRTNFDILGASIRASNTDQKVLFVAQLLPAGTLTDGQLAENVLTNDERALVGVGSMAGSMISAARKINPTTRFDVIGLADAGGATAATGTNVFTGTATENGTLKVVIGSENEYSLSIPVASGDTATDVGDAVVAAVDAVFADGRHIPVTAANVTGTVTYTARNAGTLGNFIGLSISGSVAGISYTLTAMTGGATDPDLTGVFDVISDNRYQTIVWPYFDSTSEIVNFLEGRFNTTNKVLDGVAITSAVDTFANHLTRLNALNSKTLVMFCDSSEDETNYKAASLLEMPWIKSSIFAALDSYRLTQDAPISGIINSSRGPLDAFGGPALSSFPYFNMAAPGLKPIGTGRGFSDVEIEQLFDAGGSVIGNNGPKTVVIFGEVVTTFKTDTSGNEDLSFKTLNDFRTASAIREYFFNNSQAEYQNSRLTDGDIVEGHDMVSRNTVAAFMEQLYVELSGEGFVLVRAGAENIDFFKENLVVTENLVTGRISILMFYRPVRQLRELAATLKLDL